MRGDVDDAGGLLRGVDGVDVAVEDGGGGVEGGVSGPVPAPAPAPADVAPASDMAAVSLTVVCCEVRVWTGV